MDKINIAKQMVREIIQQLPNPKSLTQIYIGGSLAREFHDQFSDIELVFVYQNCDYNELSKCIEKSQTMKLERSQTTKDGTLLDCLYFQKQKIDLMHISYQSLQAQLDLFNDMDRVDPSTQAIISCYQPPTLIWEHPQIGVGELKIKVTKHHFEKIIEYGVKQFSTQMLSIHISREDSIMIQQSLFSIQRAFLIIVFAINNTLMPGYKQLSKTIALLNVKPDKFLEKLDHISKERTPLLIKLISDLYNETRLLCLDQAMLERLPLNLDFESMRTKQIDSNIK
ncbi:MAG: hypothetical protein KC646_10495 [Candidatus Cloacimonetes bacterium]|nr:hypothetical protein [Candidatus Cloacimonadota bacterium]